MSRWVCYLSREAEGLTELQTLLYMLIQKAGDQDGTKPPPGVPPPDWAALTRQWSARLVAEAGLDKQLTLGPTELWLGHDDFEAQDVSDSTVVDHHEFGWDNEHPRRRVVVERFKVDRLPITNGEYLRVLEEQGRKGSLQLDCGRRGGQGKVACSLVCSVREREFSPCLH
jgi:formylglycine-generating enzyme required for sulfatase activity